MNISSPRGDIVAAQTLAKRKASSCLFPPFSQRLQIEDVLTRLLGDAAQRIRRGSVAPTFDRSAVDAALTHYDFQDQRDLEDVLRWVIFHMEGGVTQVCHPRYVGLFNPAPSFPSQCGERVAAFFNAQLASATTSPLPVAIEQHVIRALASRLGMATNAGGHFTTGGSEANFTAAICALTRANSRFGAEGVYAFDARPCVYVSQASHLAWLKIGHQTGIGREAIRLIATDGEGRMDCGVLRATMRADQARGYRPVLVVSTAGTTVAGMIDSLDANTEIAGQAGAWHHVDAAWGGGLVVSDNFLPALRGIEKADSITIDAHKWLATTMGCGMFITAHPRVLSDAFHVTMDCMPSNVAGLDPYVTTVQWSRCFLGLRLFVGLATVGWKGYAAHVEQAVRRTELLRARLSVLGWRVVNQSTLAVTCLRPPAGSPDVSSIVAAIVKSGEAWLSTAEFEGERIIRVCMTNGEMTEADVLRLADLLQAQAGRGA
jgi:glutamate/tyrosine decarboxylase-like PLP-dependent enzyme